ncbi:hypothetical protein DUI70_1707 [Streptomyces albus]|nr:hypothetical protein DUI70_1707 [Streptomyces albus]
MDANGHEWWTPAVERSASGTGGNGQQRSAVREERAAEPWRIRVIVDVCHR